MEATELLKAGGYNYLSQDLQPDGSVLVTLRKRGDPRVYTFRARDLYGPNEEIFDEHVTGGR